MPDAWPNKTNDLVAMYQFHSKSSDSIGVTDLRITSTVEIKWIGHVTQSYGLAT